VVKQALLDKERESVKNSLSDYLPYLDFIDNIIFYEDESVGLVLEIKPVYDETLSDEELIDLKQKLIHFLNALEDNLALQFYFKKYKDFSDLKEGHLKQNQSDSKLVKELFKKRIDKLDQDIQRNRLFRYSLFLIIRKKYDFKVDKVKSLIYSPNRLNKEVKLHFKEIIQDLKEIQEKYRYYLQKADFEVIQPSEEEVIDFVASQINQEVLKNVKFETKHDLTHCCMKKAYNHLQIGDKYFKFITLKNEPEFVRPTLIKYLTNAELNFEYDVIVNLKILDKHNQTQKLKTQKRVTRALKFDLFGSDIDEEAEAKEADISELLTDMVSGKENLFKFELLILVKADSKRELNKNCDELLSSIRHLEGAQGFEESIANFQLFLSALPGNMKFNNFRDFKFKTSYVTDLLPIFGPPTGIGEPLMIFRNKYNSVTYLNPMSDEFINKNGLTIGASGSGKSFTMNYISLNYLAYEPIILIIDKGGSYKKFVETLGGDYFEVSTKYAINPFDIKTDNKELFWRAIIEVMIREENEPISNDMKIIINEAIAKVKEEEINKPIISDFVDAIDKLEFKDQEMKRKKRKAYRHLKRWTKGRYGSFLNNKESNLDVSSDILAMDLKGLESYPEILEVFMFYISSVSWYKAELDRDRKKLFIFDEVWQLFLTEQGGQLLEEMYRTLRKYGASIFSISQSISDFADNKHTPGIMENISFFYILRQSSGADYDKLKNTLNLSKQDITEIKNLNSVKGVYSDVFIRLPQLSFIGRVVPGAFEYWMATTNSNDISLFNQVLKAFDNDLIKALNFLASRCPYGFTTYSSFNYDEAFKKFDDNIVKVLDYLAKEYLKKG